MISEIYKEIQFPGSKNIKKIINAYKHNGDLQKTYFKNIFFTSPNYHKLTDPQQSSSKLLLE